MPFSWRPGTMSRVRPISARARPRRAGRPRGAGVWGARLAFVGAAGTVVADALDLGARARAQRELLLRDEEPRELQRGVFLRLAGGRLHLPLRPLHLPLRELHARRALPEDRH